ncbi:MAG: adenylate/guanylate cyclase domain-containing protein [Fimbriimonas sp.]
MPPQTGTLTLVFTDLEGSSRLWESYPVDMSQAITRHDQILAEVIEKFDGHIFKSLGDGVCAVFKLPLDAVTAALDIQQAMQKEPWPEETPLNLRIGIHTGEAEARGNDYFGHSVNLVARLVESANGGQIILTEDTFRLLEHVPFLSEQLESIGRYRFKGIKQPQHIYQLCASGLRRDFPRLRGTEPMPNNLPEQVTSFIGRQQEMQEIRELLRRTRLLTLTGMGGSGKTRLSLEIGGELLRSGESVWFVELAPVTDERLVGPAMATALGVQVGSQPTLDALSDYLKEKNVVVILDNCEQVVDATSRVVDHLLHRAPSVRFLVSSRESLKVSGESVYQVPTLSVPKPTKQLSLESAGEFSAVQLFLDRAQAANSQFDPTQQDPQRLAQLCASLDGSPLAIELAAARIRSMTVDQMLDRIGDRFRLFTGGSRAATPRQQSLRALVDWSYDLLEQPEKDMLLRLSVFVGGWDLEAAEKVCPCDTIDELDVLDLLCSLTEKSLIIQDSKDRLQPRYRLLSTVRQYAADRISESHPESIGLLKQRHAEAYLELAERLASKLIGAQAAGTLNQLDEEHDNIRAALVWFAEAEGCGTLGLRLVVALQRFWMTRGFLREGWERTRIALQRPDCPEDGVRTLALFILAFCAMNLGEIEAARDCFNQALESARKTKDRIQEGRALSGLAGIAGDYDLDYQTSLDLNRKALEIHAEVGNKLGQAAANYNLADLTIRHDPRLESNDEAFVAIRDAERHFRAGLALFSELADVKHQGICLNGLGVIAQREGNDEAACGYFVAALGMFQKVNDVMWCGNLYKSLASLKWQGGNARDAILLAGMGIELHESLGFVPPVKEQEWWDAVLAKIKASMPIQEYQLLLLEGSRMDHQAAYKLVCDAALENDDERTTASARADT